MRVNRQSVGRIMETAKKYRYLLLLTAAAVLLLTLPALKDEPADGQNTDTLQLTVQETEEKLSRLLSMTGCGETHVMLTLQSTGEQTLAQSTKENRGDEESQCTCEPLVIRSGSNTEQVVVTAQTMPCYQGALVVCRGGDDPQVKLTVIQAVHALTGLGSDKITVTKLTEGTK